MAVAGKLDLSPLVPFDPNIYSKKGRDAMFMLSIYPFCNDVILLRLIEDSM